MHPRRADALQHRSACEICNAAQEHTWIMRCGHVQVDVEPNDTSRVFVDWLTAFPAQGSLPAQSKAAVVLHYDFRGPALQGTYNADVLITTSGTPAAMVCRHVYNIS